ncbi:cell division protein, partial [Lasius niger]
MRPGIRMFRPLELYIGLRYARAKRRNQFISFISVVSIVCITVSVMALITVMSVMNGFGYQMRSRILGAVSHVTVVAYPGQGLDDWQQIERWAHADPHTRGVAPYVELQSFLSGRASAGALVRGVDPAAEPAVSTFHLHMQQGRFDSLRDGGWNILLGNELAMQLGVTVGDRVLMVIPRLRSSPLTGALPLTRSFHVSGIYALGMQDYDAGMALINLHDAERMAAIGAPAGVRLRLDDMDQAAQVARRLQRQVGPEDLVSTWMDSNSNFFSALSMERHVMFIILSLIVLVAVINLISMLMMLVTDKQAEIAILRTLGATPRSIMGMFMVQGVMVGVVGIVLG